MVETLVHFTQSAQLWLREDNRINIGLLNHTSVSFACTDEEDPNLLLRNLKALQRQQSFYLGQLAAALEHGGMDQQRIDAFVSDCLTYGVVQQVPEEGSVAVLADAQSTSALRMLLEPQGISVLSPSAKTLPNLDPSIPIVTVNRFQSYRSLTVLARTPRTIIPVIAADGRITVGPLHLRGAGPCPLCFELDALRADDAWHTGAAAYGDETCLPPIVRTAMATHTAAVVTQVLGHPQDCLGATVPPAPGNLITIDVFRHHVGMETRRSNQQCPECFERTHAPATSRIANDTCSAQATSNNSATSAQGTPGSESDTAEVAGGSDTTAASEHSRTS